MLSICVTIKNRSIMKHRSAAGEDKIVYPFPKMVENLANIVKPSDNIELVVSDWHSDDWPLEQWIYDKAGPMSVTVNYVDDEFFSRGRGLNIAARSAKGSKLFFCDADIIIPRGLIEFILSDDRCLFPAAPNLVGHGLCVLSKEMFNQIGPWPEWTSWGGEDDTMWHRATKNKYNIWRKKVEGLIHQWHPKQHQYYEHPDLWDWNRSKDRPY